MEAIKLDELNMKETKRTAQNLKKLKVAGLAMANSYMQGLQAAIKVYEQQQAASQ